LADSRSAAFLGHRALRSGRHVSPPAGRRRIRSTFCGRTEAADPVAASSPLLPAVADRRCVAMCCSSYNGPRNSQGHSFHRPKAERGDRRRDPSLRRSQRSAEMPLSQAPRFGGARRCSRGWSMILEPPDYAWIVPWVESMPDGVIATAGPDAFRLSTGFLGESDSPRAIAMQKVVGSNPIIRSNTCKSGCLVLTSEN
jgi:hypothetical protein